MIASLTGTLFKLTDLVRLNPFDTATAEGRAKERHRRVLLSALATASAKVLSVATTLISVPLTLNYLGSERYGMWMTISSIIAMLSFADFGIGNGLVSSIAEAYGKDDRAAMRSHSSSAFFALSSIAVLFVAVFFALDPFIPWHRLFNVDSPIAIQESAPAVAVFAICFALNVPLGIVQRIQQGLQEGYVASLWQSLGSLLALLAVILAIHLRLGLPWLVAAMSGVPLLAASLNSFVFFGYSKPDLRPTLAGVSKSSMRTVAGTGMQFFLLQLAVAIAFASDNLVIAHYLGPTSVTAYTVPERLFSLISVGLGMIMAPLWPAYAEAIARRDGAWVRRTLSRSVFLAIMISAVAATMLVVYGTDILSIWVGHTFVVPGSLLVGLGLWKVIEAGASALAVFLNGAKVLRAQILTAVLMAVGSIALKVSFVPTVGIPAIVWSSIAANLVLSIGPMAFVLPRVLKSFDK